MKYVLIIIVGFISGFLYARSIYEGVKRGKNPLLTFPLRFALTALLMLIVGKRYGTTGLITFGIAHFVAVLFFTTYRSFLKP